MSEEKPPYWAIEHACAISTERANPADYKWSSAMIVADEKEGIPYAVAVMALARYIAEHEEPPVDPVLLKAREIAFAILISEQFDEGQLARLTPETSTTLRAAMEGIRAGMEMARTT